MNEACLPTPDLIEDAGHLWLYRNACTNLWRNFCAGFEHNKVDSDSLEHVCQSQTGDAPANNDNLALVGDHCGIAERSD